MPHHEVTECVENLASAVAAHALAFTLQGIDADPGRVARLEAMIEQAKTNLDRALRRLESDAREPFIFGGAERFDEK